VPGLSQQILRTDASGMPLEWIDFRQAARLHFLGLIAYVCGEPLFTLHGGINALSRRRSTIEINSIVATFGNHQLRTSYTPPLSNRTLFQRDDHLCLYCGEHFSHRQLSRDHVTPISQGGANLWSNVVTACVRCNNHKAGRTPEQANMELLAIPFAPTHAEFIYLQGRNVLADQMAFLSAHFPRTSPLRKRLGKKVDRPDE
jgi:5-methylcytosine-specific restriction endonuclease McrA